MNRNIPNDSAELSPSDITDALNSVLASDIFRRSERASSMLRYIVDETLADRGNQLKAASIATDVFGRDDDFDGDKSTIARVQASKLRTMLGRYYISEGRSDKCEIRVPKGGYLATFAIRDHSIPPQISTTSETPQLSFLRRFSIPIGGAVIVVIALVYLVSSLFFDARQRAQKSGNDVMAQVAFKVEETGGVDQQISDLINLKANGSIAKFGQLYVSRSNEDSLVTANDQPAYLARIISSKGDQKIKLSLQVTDFANGTNISSSEVILPIKDGITDFKMFETEIAKTFSQIGPVFLHLQERNDLSHDLRCVLDTMRNRRADHYDQSTVDHLIDCLQAALIKHPSLGIAGVQLAVLLIGEGDRDRLYNGGSAYVEAGNVLNKILASTPNLPGALMVMATVTFVEGKLESAFKFSRRVVEINPNSPLIRGQQGMLFVRAGRFTEGQDALEKAITLSKEPRLLHRTFLYLAMIETGAEQENIELAHIIASQKSEFFGIAAYLANIQIGNENRALTILSELNGGNPADEAFLKKTLLAQRFKPDAAQKIIDRVTQTSLWNSQFN